MLKNIRSWLNILILFFFSISVLYVVISSIIDLFSKEEVKESLKVTSENVNIYTDEQYLVREYNVYYTLEEITQTIVFALNNKKTTEVYNICDNSLKSILDKGDYNKTLMEYYNNNFKYNEADEQLKAYFSNEDNLISLYRLDQNSYICEVKTIDKNRTTRIGIMLFENLKYKITYLEI